MTQELSPVHLDYMQEQRTRFVSPTFLLQIALAASLLAGPLLVPSFQVMDVMAKIMIFTVVAASYDLILGYTGSLSLAHGMFFGMGAYALGLVCYHSGSPHWYHLILAAGIAIFLGIVFSLLISLFSLRVKAIFFAMVTLAIAEYAHILGIQWSELTLGEDGISFELPWIFHSDWSAGRFLLSEIDDRLMIYYLIFLSSLLLFMGLVRFVRSPLGRVLKSIRSNENRAVALGFKTFQYKTVAVVFGSTLSSIAGVLFAMWLRYVNPDSVLGLGLMVNVLLMVLIGGLGTLYGGIIGVAFIIVSENWLPGALKAAAGIFPPSEIITRLADRWHLYFGVLFILVIIFFPRGVVGTFRQVIARRKAEVLRKRRTEVRY